MREPQQRGYHGEMIELPEGNRIVDRIAGLGMAQIFRNARVERIKRAQITTSERRTMQTVDFPVSTLFSIVGTFADGTTAEITTIGPEGFVEIDSALRHDIALRTSICLVEGSVVRLPVEDFQRDLIHHPAFADIVYHAVRVRSFMTEQLTLCAIRHSTEERLSRWLLLATHKLNVDAITLTQEAMSGLLGTRRATISVAAASIQQSGAIRYTRGQIVILDRAALLAQSCSCFEECKNVLDLAL